MMEAIRHVLVVGSRISDDAELFRRLSPALEPAECELHRVPGGADVRELVASTSFDLVVVSFPLDHLPAEALVRAIRREGSACRRSALLVVVRPESQAQAEPLLAAGANRVLSLADPGQRMATVVSELLAVAPRVALKSSLRFEYRRDGEAEWVRAGIDNLSISGMLVRSGTPLVRGDRLSFELWLPGEDEAVRGVAEVVRQATLTGRSSDAFAARFLAFREVGRQRLEAFLMAELERTRPLGGCRA